MRKGTLLILSANLAAVLLVGSSPLFAEEVALKDAPPGDVSAPRTKVEVRSLKATQEQEGESAVTAREDAPSSDLAIVEGPTPPRRQGAYTVEVAPGSGLPSTGKIRISTKDGGYQEFELRRDGSGQPVPILPGLAQAGEPETHTYLGVSAVPPPEPLRGHLALPKGLYLMVAHVVPGSPAAEAGLKEYDILLRLDDQKIANMAQFQALVRSMEKGAEVTLTVLRAGKEDTLEATLDERTLHPPRVQPPGILHSPGPGAPGGYPPEGGNQLPYGFLPGVPEQHWPDPAPRAPQPWPNQPTPDPFGPGGPGTEQDSDPRNERGGYRPQPGQPPVGPSTAPGFGPAKPHFPGQEPQIAPRPLQPQADAPRDPAIDDRIADKLKLSQEELKDSLARIMEEQHQRHAEAQMQARKLRAEMEERIADLKAQIRKEELEIKRRRNLRMDVERLEDERLELLEERERLSDSPRGLSKKLETEIEIGPVTSGEISYHNERTDGKYKYVLKVSKGKSKYRVERIEDGKTLFEGGVNTPDEINKVPQEFRPELKDMRSGTSLRLELNEETLKLIEGEDILLLPSFKAPDDAPAEPTTTSPVIY